MTTTYQHFSLTNTELWLTHTNISPLQTQSYDYHIPTFLSYKHGAMTTTYQHFSLTNRAMTTTYQPFSLANTELWLPHTNISPLQTQSDDYHIPTFLPYKHRAVTTTYTHFSLTCKGEMLVCGSHSCVCKREMLVCDSHSSVFVRETCWYVVVIALCL
jgi:hypothetical protein